MIGICLNMTDLDLFFNCSRDVAMATDFMAKCGYMRSFGRAAFENDLQYRHSDSKIFNCNILAKFCAKMMKIGSVTPEITRVINAPFCVRGQKSGPIFTNVSALVDVGLCTEITQTYISFVVVQGTLLW